VFPLIEVVFEEFADRAINARAVDKDVNRSNRSHELTHLLPVRNVDDVGRALSSYGATFVRDPF
jgi:hypothetical protein